jgi:hypothetical protein
VSAIQGIRQDPDDYPDEDPVVRLWRLATEARRRARGAVGDLKRVAEGEEVATVRVLYCGSKA